jgi:hypothetical protein
VLESYVVTESGLKLLGWVVAAAVASAMLMIPQAVDPWEMPSLVLDRNAASDAIRFDRALAAEVPKGPEADTLRSLFLDHGRSEANPPYSPREYDQRQAEIHHASAALVEAHGRPAFESLRAQAVESFVEAHHTGGGTPSGDEAVALFGGFAEILGRYGLVRDGVLIAPELTLRSLYKARWNAIHRQPLTDGFSQIELQSYWGWFALHGWGQPLRKREEALIAFRDAGGAGTEEAAALFDVLGGNSRRAATSLQQLYAARGELRLRNMGLGALHAALFESAAP